MRGGEEGGGEEEGKEVVRQGIKGKGGEKMREREGERGREEV